MSTAPMLRRNDELRLTDYFQIRIKQPQPTLIFKNVMMHNLDHPLMGYLYWSGMQTTCDWSGTILLPSFAACYEKWNDDGSEFHHDGRSDEHKRGEFGVLVCCGSPRVGLGSVKDLDEFIDPPQPQCIAYATLTAKHENLANSLKLKLADYLREIGSDNYWLDNDEFEHLLKPKMILGTLELQSICITYHVKECVALVGMTFHSEIWEPEHGIGAIVHRDQVMGIGACECAWPSSMMGDV